MCVRGRLLSCCDRCGHGIELKGTSRLVGVASKTTWEPDGGIFATRAGLQLYSSPFEVRVPLHHGLPLPKQAPPRRLRDHGRTVFMLLLFSITDASYLSLPTGTATETNAKVLRESILPAEMPDLRAAVEHHRHLCIDVFTQNGKFIRVDGVLPFSGRLAS